LGGTIALVAAIFGLYFVLSAFVNRPVPTPVSPPTVAPPINAPAPPTASPSETVAAQESPTNPAPPTSTIAPTSTQAPQPTQAPATSTVAPTAPPPQPSAQCQPWHKRPAPGYGILLVENHIGEELTLDWTKGGSGTWKLPAKRGDEPGRWWRELPVGHHEFNDSTVSGYGHISVDVEDGKSYVSPLWYNDQKEEKLYPMEIPAGCR
jgi:hypothetical protein